MAAVVLRAFGVPDAIHLEAAHGMLSGIQRMSWCAIHHSKRLLFVSERMCVGIAFAKSRCWSQTLPLIVSEPQPSCSRQALSFLGDGSLLRATLLMQAFVSGSTSAPMASAGSRGTRLTALLVRHQAQILLGPAERAGN